jgi:hypothetical protein
MLLGTAFRLVSEDAFPTHLEPGSTPSFHANPDDEQRISYHQGARGNLYQLVLTGDRGDGT